MAVAVPARTGRPSDKRRIRALDGIRGFSAIVVLTTHVAYSTYIKPSGPGTHANFLAIVTTGWQVALGPFFLLSGLLLYRPFVRMTLAGGKRPAIVPFFVRRAARLLPACYLLVAFSLLLLNLTNIHRAWDVLDPFLLLNIYDYHYYIGLDVMWTVPAEAQFYLILPLLAWVLHRWARRVDDPAAKARRLYIPLGFFIALEFGWSAFIHAHYGPFPPQFFYPFGMAGLWAIGMALSVWSVLSEVAPEKTPGIFKLAARRPNLFVLGAFLAYVLFCVQPFGVPGAGDWVSAATQPFLDLSMLSFAFLIMVPLVAPGARSQILERGLGNRPIVFLGRISYGIYLWHFAIMYLWIRSGSVFGKITPIGTVLGKYGFWDLEIPALIGSIAVATASFYLFERPIIRLAGRVRRATTELPISRQGTGTGEGERAAMADHTS